MKEIGIADFAFACQQLGSCPPVFFASIDLLELEDAQATPLHKLAGDLTPVKAKETNHVG